MSPDLISFFSFAQTEGINLTFKLLLLGLVFVYILFTLIVISRVKVLNRTLNLSANKASAIIQTTSAIFLILGISLFLITIVIV